MNTNTNHTTSDNRRDHQDLEKSITELVGLGRVWARYGLEAGSRALQTSSKSLALTGQFLQELSDQIEATANAAREETATSKQAAPKAESGSNPSAVKKPAKESTAKSAVVDAVIVDAK